jgi:hypothetical protein
MLNCYSGRTLSVKAASGPTTQASRQSDFVDRRCKAISKYMVVIKLRILTRLVSVSNVERPLLIKCTMYIGSSSQMKSYQLRLNSDYPGS